MKKLNLLLISVLFSSLLVGCGMKGPLYRVPETATIKKTEPQIDEQNNKALEDESSAI